MPAEIDLEMLTAPFPPNAVKQRQGSGGRMLDYLPTHVVINRLNTATGNRWDFEPVSFELKGDTYVFVGKLTIPGLGTRAGIGVQKVVDKSGEDLVKGCASDCLKKCATLFGVGIELYGPDYEAGEVDAQPVRPAPRPLAPARQGIIDIPDEYLRRINGAANTAALEKIAQEMRSAGVGSDELRAAYRRKAFALQATAI